MTVTNNHFENNTDVFVVMDDGNTTQSNMSIFICPQSNEKWNVTGVMEWEKVQFINKIGSNGNYLMYNTTITTTTATTTTIFIYIYININKSDHFIHAIGDLKTVE
ncbi:hypothetical protein RFI_05653 [Reticulomyxa filosa]|uniref:Uncharacterized protein n=1 Tax=Reticulomyxa filosa TaxID=46433 RepID=X6P1P2_RETFI|nr:hypothetical protein RFI_05653 [Reticulomyxa filosa]|eukprot:ETO31467.1 hypothetical protein RFI_05653 [Reticulomyxa filosa]